MDKVGLIVAVGFSVMIIFIVSIINGYNNRFDKRVFGKVDISANIITWLIAGMFIFTALWSVR